MRPEHMAAFKPVQQQRVTGQDILVAIPTLNEAAHIEACLNSLMTGDERLADALFVVCDGGSTDGTQTIVREMMADTPNLILLDNPDRLQSAAINRVCRWKGAHGRSVLVRCDAHAIYPPAYVTRVADALIRTGAQSLATPMDAVGDMCFQRANAWIVDTPLGSGGSAHRGGRKSGYVDHGHHAGFDLATFRSLRGYDESFSHNEDAEYDYRLTQSGGRIYLDADIRLTYLPRATPWALARQYYAYGRGRARTIRKHRMKPRLRQMIPVINLVGLVAAFVSAPTFPWALIYPGIYASALVLASVSIAMSKKSLCGLLAGPASAIMHTSWALGMLREGLLGRR